MDDVVSNAAVTLDVHYQLALACEPVHLSFLCGGAGCQVLANPVSDEPSVQSSASSSEAAHQPAASDSVSELQSSKPGNEMSLQPELISFTLCLHVKLLPLSALFLHYSELWSHIKGVKKKVPQQQLQQLGGCFLSTAQPKDVAGETVTLCFGISVDEMWWGEAINVII